MKISLLQYMVTCINRFSSKNGIPSDLRLAEIILESSNTDYNKIKTTFGAYIEVYIGNSNITKHRTVGSTAI